MKKYECPYCGEKTITTLKKAFAGNQKSKGTICPNCGGRCSNGMQSTIFHTITDFIMMVIVIIMYIKLELSFIPILAVLATVFIVNKVFDILFYPLEKSMRID